MGKKYEPKVPTGPRNAPTETGLLQERGKQRSSKRLLETIINRIDRNLEFPEKVLKLLGRIAEHFTEYESFVAESSADDSDDLVETLQVYGVFSRELNLLVKNYYEALAKWYSDQILAIENRTVQSYIDSHGSPPALGSREDRQLAETINGKVERFMGRYRQVIQMIGQTAIDAQRPLLTMILEEAHYAAMALQIDAQIDQRLSANIEKRYNTPLGEQMMMRRQTTAETLQAMREHTPGLDNNDSIHAQYFRASSFAHLSAYDALIHKEKIAADLHNEAIYQWLQTVDFETDGATEPFECPSFTISGRRVTGVLHNADRKRSPFFLAGFELIVAGVGPVLAGEVSRISSDLTVNLTYFVPMSSMFERVNNKPLYDAIRHEVLRAVYRKYEREQVPLKDHATLRELLSINPDSAVTHSKMPLETTQTSDPIVLAPTTEIDVTSTNTIESEPVVTPEPVITTLSSPIQSEQKARPEERTKLSVKRVKQKIIRLGAKLLTKRGDHPHFIGPSNLPVRLYNSHEDSRIMTAAEIRKKIDLLGYTMESFWAV